MSSKFAYHCRKSSPITGIALFFGLGAPISLLGNITTYTYTGNPFVEVLDSPDVTASNYISVSFTMAGPLNPNIDHATMEQYGSGWPVISPGSNTLLEFSITDGVHTVTGPANALVQIDATSATGQITEWHILAQESGGAVGVLPFLETEFYNSSGTDISEYLYTDNISDHQLGIAFSNFGQDGGGVGSWKSSALPESPTSIPELSTAILLGPCLLVIGAFRQTKKAAVARGS